MNTTIPASTIPRSRRRARVEHQTTLTIDHPDGDVETMRVPTYLVSQLAPVVARTLPHSIVTVHFVRDRIKQELVLMGNADDAERVRAVLGGGLMSGGCPFCGCCASARVQP